MANRRRQSEPLNGIEVISVSSVIYYANDLCAHLCHILFIFIGVLIGSQFIFNLRHNRMLY
jgi:hypothetical protein